MSETPDPNAGGNPPPAFDSAPFWNSLQGEDKDFAERKGFLKPGTDGKLPSPVELARARE